MRGRLWGLPLCDGAWAASDGVGALQHLIQMLKGSLGGEHRPGNAGRQSQRGPAPLPPRSRPATRCAPAFVPPYLTAFPLLLAPRRPPNRLSTLLRPLVRGKLPTMATHPVKAAAAALVLIAALQLARLMQQCDTPTADLKVIAARCH